MQLLHTGAFGADQSCAPSSFANIAVLGSANDQEERFPTLQRHFFRPGELAAFLDEWMEDADAAIG
ncbi:hypothetical protein GGQ97_002649 [Sphingomonas kaistensis]|uniref:Uncharacterized protein n=1 Tax=Sphingomonas kaistensis TaxID=298708 RepID=A0A7X5Y8B4_9SPHN|nr:hypothetical protein [Sphingomonas kaistensis]NJC06856.1 hypothetical protein [Sphingomonas kaistensis]